MEIIAEVGSNWRIPQLPLRENYGFALIAIAQAAKAGATAVKFQLFRAESLYSVERAGLLYKRAEGYELPIGWLPSLQARCHALGLKFGLSVFSCDLIEEAADYTDFLKVASGDLTNPDLMRKASYTAHAFGMPLLISTGASYRGEILQALREAELWKVRDVILLQCVSLYPAQPRHYNLAALDLFRPKVGALGLSDHTLSDKASLLALARGYTWFEKHFAPLGSEEAASPDHVVSLFPDDFASWVGSLREAEAMLGPVPKAPLEEEFAERTYARRGADGLRPAGEGLTRQEYGGDDPESEVEEMVI